VFAVDPEQCFTKVDVVDIRDHVFYKHVLMKMITLYDIFLHLDERLTAKHQYIVRVIVFM